MLTSSWSSDRPTVSNSQRLREVIQEAAIPAYLINDETDIEPEWLTGAEVVGVTAGASAPEELVLRVVDHLKSPESLPVEGLTLEEEDVHFSIPQELESPTFLMKPHRADQKL